MICFFYFIHLNNVILIILNIINVLTHMDKKNILSVKNLKKIYSNKQDGETHALNNLNLDVKEGEIFGLLGPNGAGKTTFINILAGTVIKTAGQVNVWGFDLDKNPRQVRASVGIVPQEVNLDPFFSPRKLLELQAGLYGIKEKDRITDTILNLVSLEKQANSYARSLSGGMKRRLLMAKALVHQPPIIFLDEPTAGVDVELRKNLWKNVRLLNELGVTIILTTHYLEEAEEMCDRIAILNKGNIVALDSTKNLLNRIQTKKVTFKTDKNIDIKEDDLESLKIISKLDNEVCVSYEKSKVNIEELINLIKKNNVKIIDISTDDGDLEDVFLRLIKN
jgi:ABC-2 type transport system ATP-binding protein